MARLLGLFVFLGLQGSGAAIAFLFHGSVNEWMTGGHWVAPAVRVPLVVVAAAFAELLILAAVFPCNRMAANLLGYHCGPINKARSA